MHYELSLIQSSSRQDSKPNIYTRMSPFLFVVTTLLLLLLLLPLASSVEEESSPSPADDYDAFQPSPADMWNNGPIPSPNYNKLDGDGDGLVLAPRTTYRKDPLHHFHFYTAGWNITNRHYWASVSYSAAPVFTIAAIWFVLFLFLICLCYCCGLRRPEPYAYSPLAYALSFIFLLLLSLAAIIGCVVLYTGQDKLESSSIKSLEYVMSEADETSDSLRKVSQLLVSAKQTNVVQVSLPPILQTDIDQLQTTINSAATMLTTKTQLNSQHFNKLIHSVRLGLIIITAVVLLLTLLGFAFSTLGMTFPVYIVVTAGWILVTATFILAAIFLLLHNVTGDTCTAMNQWVQNPSPHTALDDILPCIDPSTVQQALAKSKQVTFQLVDLINTVITNVSNINFASNFIQLYYNQSGPLLPTLCNPFHPDLSDRPCSPAEVQLDNATQVWSGSVCRASPSGICFTTGRLSPNLYSQFSATVDVCNGLYQYTPFLMGVEDCSYGRQTFLDIRNNYCPGLQKYSRRVYVGLLVLATALMLSLLFWVIFARERRHRHHTRAADQGKRSGGFVYAKDDRAAHQGEGVDA